MKIASCFILIFSLLINSTIGDELETKENKDKSASKPFNEMIVSSTFEPSQIGIYVYDLDSKKAIWKHNADKLFVPASVSKVVTTLGALEILGASYRFQTEISYTGTIEKGELKGDLYLIGKGDPFLTAAKIFSLAQALRETGIRKISGDFFYDESHLASTSIINPIGEPDKPYNPGIGALSSEFNRAWIWRYGRSRRTSKSQFETIPMIDSLSIAKENSKFKPGVRFQYAGEEAGVEKWNVSLRDRYRRKEEIPIRNPGLYTAGVFRRFAKDIGIELPKPKSGISPKKRIVVQIALSDTVEQLCESTLEYSNNVVAELLLLNFARQKEDKKLTIKESAGVLLDWIKSQIKDFDWGKVEMRNGSGMTSENRFTPQSIVEILKWASDRKFGNRYYWSMLSISGWKGWIRKRLHDPKHAMRVWAKTGSLDYANAIAGYLLTEKGHRLAFGIFILDEEKRDVLDEGLSKKAKLLRDRSMSWRQSALGLQDMLLAELVDNY